MNKINVILRYMFEIGVMWMMLVIVCGAFGFMVPISWSYPSIPLIFIPKALWSWDIVEDPFDKL